MSNSDDFPVHPFVTPDGKVVVPAGEYFLGDLCLLHDQSVNPQPWDDYIATRQPVDGGHIGYLAGRPVVILSTKNGDGFFEAENYGGYGCEVQSGGIGLVSCDGMAGVLDGPMNQVEYEEPAECHADENGVLTFGDIAIETDPVPSNDQENLGDKNAEPSGPIFRT